jgi:hypothetical protein
LNTASNNFLEWTNYNYSCHPLNKPINCMEDFAMPEIIIRILWFKNSR